MRSRTRTALTIAALAVIAITADHVAPRLGISLPGLVTEAEARVGRPLTPVSVAGVGRRTVRRCAVGVYDC